MSTSAEAAKMQAMMFADLGVGRRDLVSAPEEEKRRVPRHVLAQEQAEVQQHVSAHRARTAKVTSGKGDERASKISAWNNPNSFDQDEVTEQLENRFDGQGHRAALKRKMGYDHQAESLQNRFGEERQLYLSERNMRSSNRQAFAATTKQDLFAQHVLGGASSQRESKACRMVDDPSSSPRGRGKAPAPRMPKTNAAPEPVGRTRFVRDQVISQTGASQAPNGAVHAATTAQVQPPLGSGITTDPAQGPVLFNPEQAAALRRGQSPSAKSTTSSTRTRGSRGRGKGFKDFTNPEKLEGFKALRIKTTPNILPALSNPATNEVYRLKARWYAANPGLECDLYHEKFPERKPFLELAVKELIEEVVMILKNGDQRDMELYIETHAERKWMAEAAVQAKELVEHSSAGEIQAYCLEHPSQEAFIKFAESHFNPKPRQDSVMATTMDDFIVTQPKFPANEPDTDTVMSNGGGGYVFKAPHLTSNEKQTTAPSSHAQPASPQARPTPPHARNKRTTAQAAFSSSPASVNTEHKSAKVEVEADVPVSPKNTQPTQYEAPKEASSSSPLPEAQRRVDRVFSSEEEGNDSFATSIEPEVTEAEVETEGMLTATCYDVAGGLKKIQQFAVAAPVMATINIMSKIPEYNPAELINEIEALAERMVERTKASNGAKATNGLSLVAYDSDEEL